MNELSAVDYVVVDDTAVRMSTAKLLGATFLFGTGIGFGLGYSKNGVRLCLPAPARFAFVCLRLCAFVLHTYYIAVPFRR
jgi:hypothetical protein